MKAEWCMQIRDVERKSHYLKGVKADTVVREVTKVTHTYKRLKSKSFRQSDGSKSQVKSKLRVVG